MARVVYVEPTDPVIELPRQACQSSGWHPKQRLDLVRSQLKSELETGTGRVPKEIPPKPGVRQQTTERAFHVSLAHAPSRPARIAPSVFTRSQGRFGAAWHVSV
jgi:hypothetical protein